MNHIALLSIAACTQLHAAFLPLSLEEKSINSDFIAKGKVISIYKTIPDDATGDTHYFGPKSIAVIKINEVIKPQGSRNNSWCKGSGIEAATPLYITIPCDYSFHESPSELSIGTEYILFLKSCGNNIYHPLDPASTHVVYNNRVRLFGMNHPPRNDKEFQENSIQIEEFKQKITLATKSASRTHSTPKQPPPQANQSLERTALSGGRSNP